MQTFRLLPCLLLLSVSLAAPALAGAQADSPQVTLILGRVRLPDSTPAAGVAVTVAGAADVILTNSDGRFRLATAPGARSLRLRGVGWVPFDTVIDARGSRITLDVVLRRTIGQLDSVRIVASGTLKPARYAQTTRFDQFYERRRSAIGGAFLTRTDIERANVMEAADLLRGLVGVRILRGPTGTPVIRFERCVTPQLRGGSTDESAQKLVQLFVDGVRVSDAFGALSTLKAGDVEAMEVYQGVAQLPAIARGDGCAAIFVWTRYTSDSLRTAP